MPGHILSRVTHHTLAQGSISKSSTVRSASILQFPCVFMATVIRMYKRDAQITPRYLGVKTVPGKFLI